MTDLIQHCFQCDNCSNGKPCFVIYVEIETISFSSIEQYVKAFKCSSFSKPVFEHKYSIPYVGDNDV